MNASEEFLEGLETRRLCEFLLENHPAVIYILELISDPPHTRPLYVSPRIEELTGWTPEEIEREENWWLQHLHPEDREEALQNQEKLLQEGRLVHVYRFQRKNGTYLWIKDELFLYPRSSKPPLILGHWTDITPLYEQTRRFELILTYVHDIIAIVDHQGIIRFKSPSVERILGWQPEEVLGQHFSTFIHPADLYMLEELRQSILNNPGQTFRAEYRVRTKTGDYLWMEGLFYLPPEWEELGLEGVIVTEKDITERKRAETQLLRITFYDPLTGLPNRLLFLEKLKEFLHLARRREELLAVVVLDIRRLGEINTTYGLKRGDEILKEVGHRLRAAFRASDLVSRFLADEFGLIFTGLKNRRTLYFLLEKIEQLFRQPFVVDGHEIYIKANLGVAFFPFDGETAEELIRKAETALLDSKRLGEGGVAFFSEKLDQERIEANIIRHSLREALRRKEFILYFQPIHHLKVSRVVGVEALLRWQHPRLGLLSPLKFIPVAEETGDILEVGYYVLEEALRTLSYLKYLGYEDLYMAVNFSTKQFLARDLVRRIENLLQIYCVTPEALILEITESTAMKDPRRTQQIIKQLKELGTKIAIDDFGTGYSSLEYLVNFDVDKIKVEKVFVQEMLTNPKAENVVKTVIDLTHSLGASALAEGVETSHHLRKLETLGCDEVQGYYFARPCPLKELEKYLAEQVKHASSEGNGGTSPENTSGT